VASNFVALSLAEVVCRATSVLVTVRLTHVLDPAGYGRIEFAFNVVCWLVLLVREGFDVIAAREIARHPRLVRPMVNHVLAVRGLLALGLLGLLLLSGGLTLSRPTDRAILGLYGLLLLTTAMGLDYVFRGLEQMRLVAVSLVLRTLGYAAGVTLLVRGPEHLVWVPICLVAGEAAGIAVVWGVFIRRYGLPRPWRGGSRFARVMLRRGRPVYAIQVSQALLGTIDLIVVGLLSRWGDVGLYCGPHRMVTAVLTFGLIFQQVVFPGLARSWRETPESGRRALNALVRVLVLGLLPIAVGTTVLARPLVAFLFPRTYAPAIPLLALGVWRAPLLTLAFLYQTALIALNREASGVRLLLSGAIGAVPLVAGLRWALGLNGAVLAIVLISLVLLVVGHRRLAQVGRAPAWHHHVGRPLVASLAMIPACLLLQHTHVLAGVAGGAATYLLVLNLLGGLRRKDLQTVLGRAPAPTTTAPPPNG
jgi:O-antigen/teichoic acid export membrane protein